MPITDTKKNTIIFAAISEFAKKGFEKASIDAIALHAKVAKGTIFYHFRSKQALLDTVLEEGEKRFEEQLRAELYETMPVEEQLRVAIRVERDFVTQYRDLFTVLLQELLTKRRQLPSFEKIIAQGRRAGEFRKDIETTALSQAIFWQVALLTLTKQPAELEEFIVQGLRVPRSGAS